MGKFGWAYVAGGAITASYGPDGSLQFKTGDQEISGSDRLIYTSGTDTLHLTGTLIISGAISASSYHITDIQEINASGSTFFGETNDDRHIRTGSFIISSASSGRLSDGTPIFSASVENLPGASFVYSSKLSVGTTSAPGTPDLLIAGTISGSNAVFNGSLEVSGNTTLGNASTDIVTTTGQLTASQGLSVSGDGLYVPDDKKIYFGTGQDVSIEYDEDGTDELRFAGANVIFEQDITANGTNAYFKSATSNRPRVYVESSNADANAGQLIFNKTSSSPANNDVIGSVVFSSYDAGGGQTVYGSMVGEIKTVTAGSERGKIKFNVAEYDGTLTEALTIQGASTDGQADVTLPAGNLTIVDDRKLQFGDGLDASFEYDEDGTDTLLYAGASMRISDDVKIEFGTGGDASIEYNENGDDLLIISGSTKGLVLSGSYIYFDGTVAGDIGLGAGSSDVVTVTAQGTASQGMTISGDGLTVTTNTTLGNAATDIVTITGQLTASQGITISGDGLYILDDKKIYFGTGKDASFEYDEDGTDTLLYAGASMRISDDIKLQFGTDGDAHIEYNENGDNLLIISGAVDRGTVISGALSAPNVASGSIAGPGSYLGVDTTGKLVLTASSGGGTPGGSDTQVQYNNGGAFGGIASLLYDDSGGHLTIIDDKKLYFGTGTDASFEYDEDGTDTLLYAGASMRITDDVKLEFGLGGDAYIEYDENGRDRLILSGAKGGFEISGSGIYLDPITVASGAIAGDGSYLGVTAAGLIVLTASSGGGATPGGSDTQMQYNDGGSDLGGISVFTWDDTNLKIADDTKLYFGTNSDAHVEYNENGDNLLIISGSHTGGIVLSGSNVVVSTTSGLTVKSGVDDAPELIIQNESDGMAGGVLIFKRTTTDEAANDIVGMVQFQAMDAAGNNTFYATINGEIDDPTSGGEEGRLVFKVAAFNGSLTEGFRIEGQASAGVVNCRVHAGSLQLKDLGGDGTTPASGFGGIYVNNDDLYFIDDSGTKAQLNVAGATLAGNQTFSGVNTFSNKASVTQLTASTGIDIEGGISYNTAVKTENFTVTISDCILFCDLTASVITGTLPAAGTAGAGATYTFKDVSGSASAYNLVISGSSGALQTIDGADLVKITSNSGSVTVVSNGNNWFIVGTS